VQDSDIYHTIWQPFIVSQNSALDCESDTKSHANGQQTGQIVRKKPGSQHDLYWSWSSPFSFGTLQKLGGHWTLHSKYDQVVEDSEAEVFGGQSNH